MIKAEAASDKAIQKQKVRERYGEHVDKNRLIVIPATEEQINIYDDDKPRRVAVYARVSTDSIQQTSSYELQKNYYTSFVESHASWELVKIYADEGISGTSLNHRNEFNAMIADCKAGKIDLIVTKSVSRFARNIVDCISLVRMLKSLSPSVGVYFEAEHIFTLKDNTDMSLAFTATMAQEESHTKSTIMNMSFQMRGGLGKFLTPELLGYKHDENGMLVINEEEAGTVKLIFYMYLYGYTCQYIADLLSKLSCKTKRGNTTWSTGSVQQILRNERHCGDIRAGKTYTPDYLTHKSKKNTGQRPMYGMQDHHEAIISRDDFIAVQRLLDNAKYGSRGFLPEVSVIHKGIFAGFISINPRWAAFTAQDYLKASQSIKAVEPIEETDEYYADRGDFDYRGYDPTHSQFFSDKQKERVTISKAEMKFSISCLNRISEARFVELLVDPEKRIIVVRAADKTEKNKVVWSSINPAGGHAPRPISGTAFLGTLYELFGWYKDYRYRIDGRFVRKGNESFLIFEADKSEVLIPSTDLLKDTDATDANVTPICIERKANVVAYSQALSQGFGDEFYRQAKHSLKKPDLTDETWYAYESAIPYSDETRLQVTSPEILAHNIRSIIGSIQEAHTNAE